MLRNIVLVISILALVAGLLIRSPGITLTGVGGILAGVLTPGLD